MPPYNNQMFPSGMGIPQPPGPMGAGGQMQIPGMQGGGVDPQMFQQYLRIMQGQQNGPGMQPPNPGMQSMTPDQGMNQAPGNMGLPQAPPGWMGSIQTKPGMGGNMEGQPGMGGMPGAYPGGLPPGVAETMRGFGMGQPGGMPMPGGGANSRTREMRVGPGTDYNGDMPGHSWDAPGSPGYGGGSGPFMPPGMDPGQGQLQQKPMLRPPYLGGPGMGPGGPGQQSPPIQAQPQPRMPPMPRPPPNAGVWQNPLTKQMVNQMPKVSGQQPTQAAPQTGGVMNGPPNDVPGGLSSPADPIRVPLPASGTAPEEPGMVTNMDKPKKAQGAPPFNPQASGRKWQPSQKPQTRDEKKASVATRKFTSAAVR